MKFRVLNIIKLFVLVVCVYFCGYTSVCREAIVTNNNLNKTVNLSQMALKISEFNYDELYSAKDTFVGDLTGYIYNCPLCNGHLACLSSYDIMNGTVTYSDEDYGIVNIVASSPNLPCGTIIRFNSSRISDAPIYAIVLDRGVIGNSIDFLSPDYEYATRVVGRSSITYDILRNGWNLNES